MTGPASTPPALALRGIVKRFDGVPALRGASLTVPRGTVHGLIGQNGAGKSTLIKILAGIHEPDAGRIEVDGLAQQGAAAGIGFIHQERLLAPTLTVAEALSLGREPALGPRAAGALRLLDRRRMRRAALEALEAHFGVTLPPDRLIGELSLAEQQLVQITRVLVEQPAILVFDEPTAALVSREVSRLLRTIEQLRERGQTILYVSHYLNEIAQVCDGVTVLRDGTDVAHFDARATSVEAMVAAMIGEHAPSAAPAASAGARTAGPARLSVRALSAPGRFADVSFSVGRGEIVGVTGLLGSGGKPLVRSLFGLERGVSGSLALDGRALRLRSPRDAVRQGIAFVPEDRRAHGVAPALSVRENISLASLARVSRFGLVARARETGIVAGLIDALAIRTPGSDAPVRQLSGGNQQKVALAKWLSRDSHVYLLDEPTIGVDIGAKHEIYRLLARLAREGASVLLFSSDLIELLGITDRVLVMARGRLVRELVTRDTDRHELLAWATGARGSDAFARGQTPAEAAA
ncbi:sugar ABC transporter ATP-binding protein [Burkholderia glumae]|uniref:sugar ABC transporter ATP-binding protein n=2 Tax=Burkholderia glumae TaxID=337 RepID=UPI001463FC8B|nr:sugar ABC transporter ATP-binding protein [Burkholderia glumae]MCM2493625.1 sugar ABC transporter ATP-binding protein [Burkholderia glumae]MCM2543753.1 sugar ABC transporter ATP-binding protein [Burkholderia glumae]QJP71380.1 sugar ABC transporter ATP-binding protein [Burkholderia glumae]UVS95528.1 sugar ABC transporter ATP-binding protein [Burkholderia glumae]